jgi:hypothetical protein
MYFDGSGADGDLDAVSVVVPRRPLQVRDAPVRNVEWRQDTNNVHLFITHLDPKYNKLKVEFGPAWLRVSSDPAAGASTVPILNGRLVHEVKADACSWDVSKAGTVVEIVLVKRLQREWMTLFDEAPPRLPAHRHPPQQEQRPVPHQEGELPAAAGALATLNELRERLRRKVEALDSSVGTARATNSSVETAAKPPTAAASAGGSSISGAHPGPQPDDVKAQLCKPPQKITPEAAAAMEAGKASSAASKKAFDSRRWEDFDENAAIAELENEGKPVVSSGGENEEAEEDEEEEDVPIACTLTDSSVTRRGTHDKSPMTLSHMAASFVHQRCSVGRLQAGRDDVQWKVTPGRGKHAAHHITVDEYAKDPEEIAIDGATLFRQGIMMQRPPTMIFRLRRLHAWPIAAFGSSSTPPNTLDPVPCHHTYQRRIYVCTLCLFALAGEIEGKMGQLQARLQSKLRDAVACKNRGNAAVSALRGAPTHADWEVGELPSLLCACLQAGRSLV